MIETEGTVLVIIFTNETNGYTILKIWEKNTGDETVLVGYIPFINVGDTIKVWGNWVPHAKFGMQFKVERYEKSLPQSQDAIKFFLSSGMIKGVGVTLADRIVDTFKEDTLDIIMNCPDELSKVKGVTKKKAQEISNKVNENLDLRKVTAFLSENNIPTAYLTVIYKEFKENTIEKIKENPYILTKEPISINFKIADRIASKLGIDMYIEERNKSAVGYILNSAKEHGHEYLPIDQLRESAKKLLAVNDDELDNILSNAAMDSSIVFEKNDAEVRVYLESNFYAQNYVAAKLYQMSQMEYIDDEKSTQKSIHEFEKEEAITLDDAQKKAIKLAVQKGVFVLTGGPGTGKTTIIKSILYILGKEDQKVLLAAPTGRAAKRMTEITGIEAKTIHRLLEMDVLSMDGDRKFTRNEKNPLDTDVLIVDEASMIDLLLMKDLLKAVSKNTRLILVGDINQLPPIGVGSVLKDIIKSETIDVVCLTEIFRQAKESLIISNAHKINKGEMPDLDVRNKDFFFIEKNNTEDALKTIVGLCKTRLQKTYGYDPMKHIQVITPMRRGALGCVNLNKVLQEALNQDNKNSKDNNTYTLKVGDKVMQVRNNYNIEWNMINDEDEYGEGVFNGDIGVIDEIDARDQNITVVFEEEKIAQYEFDILDELELAYAITAHKSQGSEFEVVIIPLVEAPTILLTRNLLYTAVTRAKEMVIIVGAKDTVKKMVNNAKENKKYSALAEKIRAQGS
ncbi:MAG: ATP-dependent RecD-like DNA helicase [Clostridiales bacterium]|nr:ATP-dependent RecD-like DNA helicase [Clostridiales bacterium]